MGADELTKRIDRLWISALRGFNPQDIEFKNIGLIRRDTTRPLWEICKKTDSRTYLIVPEGKEIHLDYAQLNGWTGNGYQNTDDGYDSVRYLAFRDGCLNKEPPKNPMGLSFKEAQELYGDMAILKTYQRIKEAYDLGVDAIKKWPDFLNVDKC